MRNIICAVIVGLICALNAVAQNDCVPTIGYGPDYTIYLKNGKTVKGKLLKEEGDEIRVFLDTLGVWRVYNKSRVEKVEMDSHWGKLDKMQWVYADTVPLGRTRRYVNAGYVRWDECRSATNSVNVNISYGYQFNQHAFLGAGIGFDCGNDVYMPLFVHLRVDFLSSRTTPFIEGRGGYSFDATGMSGVGMYLNPAIGIRFFVGKNWPLNASIGYVIQSISTYDEQATGFCLTIGTAF